MHDYVIVGSGLTGATVARLLHDAGRDVLVVERRPVVGGNVRDAVHPLGDRYSLHGPHYFRTDEEEVWAFVNRFARFFEHSAVVKAMVDGRLENWPVSGEYIRRTQGKWLPDKRLPEPRNFEEASLAKMPGQVYERFVEGYTRKMWGVHPSALSADLSGRFQVHHDNSPCLTPDKLHQGLPAEGYNQMMERMLAGIPTLLNWDWLKKVSIPGKKLTIFTGPIDEFFGFDLGRLPYRSMSRLMTFETGEQTVGQVNYPDEAVPFLRRVRWHHLQLDKIGRKDYGLTTTETPFTPDNPDRCEYPFPSDEAGRLYRSYRERADLRQGVAFAGRLGTYQYLDMDVAIRRAMDLAKGILKC